MPTITGHPAPRTTTHDGNRDTVVSRLEDMLHGNRKGFGHGRQVIRLADAAAARRGMNWVLPGLLGLLIGSIALFFGIKMTDMGGFPYMMLRIIVVDYLVFFFGWICAWNAASRWRNNQSFIEELVVTNLRPAIVGNLLFAGSMGVWIRLLGVIMLLDLAMISFHSPGLGLPDAGSDLASALGAIIGFVLCIPCFVLLAWFHLETLRIAYWMFAVAALPQVKLMHRAVVNLFLICLYVTVLTGIGSMVTGLLGLIGGAAFTLMTGSPTGGGPGTNPFAPMLPWALASIPGLLVVGFLKRQIVTLYEMSFWRAYILFCWFGAGETEHPRFYSEELTQHVGPWIRFLREEENEA